MANPRSTRYDFDQEMLNRFNEAIVADSDPDTASAEIHRLFAYLTTWALDSYDSVQITLHVDEVFGIEAIAYYHNIETNRRYVIGARWDKPRFSFNS